MSAALHFASGAVAMIAVAFIYAAFTEDRSFHAKVGFVMGVLIACGSAALWWLA